MSDHTVEAARGSIGKFTNASAARGSTGKFTSSTRLGADGKMRPAKGKGRPAKAKAKLEPQLSSRQIAELCRVSDRFVSGMRGSIANGSQCSTITTKDGRQYPAKRKPGRPAKAKPQPQAAKAVGVSGGSKEKNGERAESVE